ncbi:DUF3383 family protein [Domibacillus iocasae]|uniref:DUF3383 domain-containing protein n=1 Tax=Domibacillus iocasae TaxID=1714016 RepID=A0A1E7DQ60_9BACI|nr:DUF3383 family protein [Domibacillus iocasae]OES45230.1 hypothetical protein BA724_04270 [Domibacillus iocasae]
MPIRDVSVNIALDKPIGLAGFGKPLIIGQNTDGFAYKEYLTLESLEADFAKGTDVYKKAQALLDQDNRPARFAVAGYDSASTDATVSKTAAELVAASLYLDWYFLITTSNTPADIVAVADAIEASKASGYPKMYSGQVAAAADLATVLAKGYERTFVGVHPITEALDAANVGENGNKEVGSITWKGKSLNGITPQVLTADELAAIEDANGYAYLTKAGDNVTSEGKVMSGEYIDVMHGLDWVTANIEQRVQKVFNNKPKVAYTDGGISQLESAVLSVLKIGFRQGIIADDETGAGIYSTSFRLRSETTPEERASRKYTGGNFNFELAGAIHEAAISGTVSQ